MATDIQSADAQSEALASEVSISEFVISAIIERSKVGDAKYNSLCAIFDAALAFVTDVFESSDDTDDTLKWGEKYARSAGNLISHYMDSDWNINDGMRDSVIELLDKIATEKTGDTRARHIFDHLLEISEKRLLCELIRTDWEIKLGAAARDGDIELAKIAHSWGAHNYDLMLSMAGGNEEIIALAREWSAEK